MARPAHATHSTHAAHSAHTTQTPGDPIRAAFELVAQQKYAPRLHRVVGALRFDITMDDKSTQVWRFAVDHGAIQVTHERSKADAVITCNADELRRILSGQETFVTGYLNGNIGGSGDIAFGHSVLRALL